MRFKALIWVLGAGCWLLGAGCGSGSSLVGGVPRENDAVALQVASPKPSIGIARPSLAPKRLPEEGGPVAVGATVRLKNLTPEQVTVTATAVDGKKNVIATQPMTLGDGEIWRTGEAGLVIPPNLARKAVSINVNIVVTTVTQPALRKSLKAGTVTVARSTADPNQPPQPPTF